MNALWATCLCVVGAALGSDDASVHDAVSFLQTSKHMDNYSHPVWLSECRSIFLDVGSNEGVQVRKFYEAEKYPDALMLESLDDYFGPPEARRVPSSESGLCVLGFEPNPDHYDKLQAIEEAYQAKGWHAHFYRVAVWKSEGTLSFQVDGDPEHKDWAAKLRTDTSESAEGKSVFDVRTIDFADFVSSLPAGTVKFMKMDIEGAEYETVARMLEEHQLCDGSIDHAFIEAHPWGEMSLWTAGFGPNVVINEVQKEDCKGSKPTDMIDVDDETYLFDIDENYGVPPFASNETALELYRQDPEWANMLPESQGGRYETWREEVHPEWEDSFEFRKID